MLNKLSLFYHTIKYSNTILRRSINKFLDFYIGHHKVIGTHKGRPVFSSFLNPLFSTPVGDLIANRLISNLMQEPRPGMMHFAITDKCQANCKRCSFYSAMNKDKIELSTIEAKKIIKESQELGVVIINFVGGEPLLRKDILKLISTASNKKSTCSLYTNGIALKENAKRLKKAGLLFAIVSIDSIHEEIHDQMRGVKGTFKKAIAGIKECQKEGLLTGISTVMKNEDLFNGNLEKMIKFAKKLQVNEVIVYGSAPVGKNKNNKPNNLDFTELLKFINKYSKKKNYPGIVFYPYIKHPSKFGCTAGRNFFYIDPYGDMHPCDFSYKSFGNTKNGVYKAWKNLSNKRKNVNYMNNFCENYK